MHARSREMWAACSEVPITTRQSHAAKSSGARSPKRRGSACARRGAAEIRLRGVLGDTTSRRDQAETACARLSEEGDVRLDQASPLVSQPLKRGLARLHRLAQLFHGNLGAAVADDVCRVEVLRRTSIGQARVSRRRIDGASGRLRPCTPRGPGVRAGGGAPGRRIPCAARSGEIWGGNQRTPCAATSISGGRPAAASSESAEDARAARSAG